MAEAGGTEPVYTVLLPRATKKDTGGITTPPPSYVPFHGFFYFTVKTMTKNSAAYKRPVAIRRTNLRGEDKKLCLVYVLQHLRYTPPPLYIFIIATQVSP